MNTGSVGVSKEESKRASEGGFFFNNWRSYERYYCTRAFNTSFSSEEEETERLSAELVYAVIDMDYERGLKIIERIG